MVVDRGKGRAVVLIPGIQGGWEWMHRTVEAMAESFRVITFSLCDEPRKSGGHGLSPATLDDFAAQVASALDRRQIERAAICGISFGGLIALRFAAQHPTRTEALILASTPGPQWRLRPTHEVCAR